MSDLKKIALDAVERMRTELGDRAVFPSDEIWSYTTTPVPSPNRPSTITWLHRQGYIVRTGQMTNAASEARAGSMTPQYGFPPTGSLSASSQSLGALAGNFEDSCEGILRVVSGSTLRLVSALLSKRFLILTGLAGSGKTKLALAFARWLSPSDGYYEVVPVGADWTGRENILGYPNGLADGSYVSKPTLDLLIHANANGETPHFLILDEMNLSHVERYFSDILSAIESEEPIKLHDDSDRKSNGKEIPPSIVLPSNLFIIGTVNVDETTYMFSPKVLDRANVIEFRMDDKELASFLSNPAKPDLKNLDGKGAAFGQAFVAATIGPAELSTDVTGPFKEEMLLFFRTLRAHGAEFGFRTAHEAGRFIHFYKMLGNHSDNDSAWFSSAFDCVIFQKLLPKLHGSRAKLGPLLKVLWFLSVNRPTDRGENALEAAEIAARSTDQRAEPSVKPPDGAPYPMSAEKIGRMWGLLRDNGFASFAEA